MGDTIKFKKGLKENLPTLGIGEPGFTTNVDDQRMYIGGPNGNVAIPNMDDVNDVNSKLDNIKNNYYSLYDSVSIEEGTDLNNLGIGNYVCSGSIVGKTLLNTPTQGGFTMKTERATGEINNYIMQTINTIGTPPNIYKRTKNSGIWGQWYKIQMDDDSGWIDLVLLNGVTATITPQYRKIGNVVYIRGNINNISADNITFANIPQGFRFVGGGTQRVFNLPLGGTKIAKISIDNGGNCKFLMTNADHNIGNIYVLDNIIYIIN